MIKFGSVKGCGDLDDVTYTRREKPRTCKNEKGTTNLSQPRPKLTIQMARVLHVSVKERAVALTWRVTLSPKKLNNEILIAMAIPDQNTVGVLMVWCHPRGRSKKGVMVETDGIDRMGNKSTIEVAPNNPS